LLELVVVLAILVVLAGLIVPLISAWLKTNAATNATVADDVSRAVGRTTVALMLSRPDGIRS
jgi:Tfp pilus assembly protein FimT